MLDQIRAQLLTLAGDSPTRSLVADSAADVLSVLLELRADIQQHGAVTRNGRIRASAKEQLRWTNELTKLLQLLGLDTADAKPDPSAALNAYIERRAAERGDA